MKRSPVLLVLLLSLISILPVGPLPAALSPRAAAKDTWTSVRSKHFFLIGNASERDIRKVAAKLEQFREAFSRLLTKAQLNSPVPTTVIVFKSDASYRPFKPLYQGKPSNVSGYFQPGQDINYITLTSELRETNPYGTIFHEYVHALTNYNLRLSPLWFREGLAEYYSTFETSDGDKKVWLGKLHANHVYLLREKKFLPLQTLLSVEHGSPHYNEQERRGVFYAQSWALVHYMLLGKQGQRQPQFNRYLDLLATGTPVDESFRQAFQTDYATLEKELRDYISRDSYPVQIVTLKERLEIDAEMQSAPLSEAEAQAHLGDLLLRTPRLDDADTYLKQALALNPDLPAAHASLGMLRMRQRRFDEAKQHLQRAIEASAQSYLAHYYYAFTLSREGVGEDQVVSRFAPEKAEIMRRELKKAIELAPHFPESYRLLAFVNLVTGEELDDAIALLKRGQSLAPSRGDFALMLARIYLTKQDFNAARQTVEPIARHSNDPETRAEAVSLLETINSVAERMASFNAERHATQTEVSASGEQKPKILIQPGPPSLSRRVEGEQARGLLTRMDCDEKGITLVIQADDRTINLHATAADRIRFVINTTNFKLDCGPFNPGVPVLVTYRSSTDARSKFDGEPLVVEFLSTFGRNS